VRRSFMTFSPMARAKFLPAEIINSRIRLLSRRFHRDSCAKPTRR
jgi:hypothetical protein